MDQFLLGMHMSVEPFTSIQDYWGVKDNGFVTAKRFGEKTGMIKHSGWEQIRGWHLGTEGSAEEAEKADEWYRISHLLSPAIQ